MSAKPGISGGFYTLPFCYLVTQSARMCNAETSLVLHDKALSASLEGYKLELESAFPFKANFVLE